MAATLSADMGDTDKVVHLIAECRNMSIKMLPPDIMRSGRNSKVIGTSVDSVLEGVKGVGGSAIEVILDARDKEGSFSSIEDFIKRADSRKVNKKVVENLIKGGIDLLGLTRARAMLFVQDSLNGSRGRSLLGQQNIFGSQEEADTIKEWDEMEILSCEKRLSAFMEITGHPIMKHGEKLPALHIKRTCSGQDF